MTVRAVAWGFVILLFAAAAAGALAIDLGIRRTYRDNERQFPREPCINPLYAEKVPLKIAFEIFGSLLGDKKEQFVWLTEFRGGDDHDISINAVPRSLFTAPYVVINDDEVAIWNRDPRGLIVLASIAKKYNWHVGDTVTIKHAFGSSTGVVSVITEGMSRKAIFHPEQLDSSLPEQERGFARFICAPMTPAQYDDPDNRKRIEAAFTDAGYAVQLDNAIDYLDGIFGEAPVPRISFWLARLLLVACFLVFACAYAHQLARGAEPRRLIGASLCLATVGSAAMAAYLHHRFSSGGIEAATWFMASVPISARDATHAAAVVLGGVILVLAITHVLARRKRAWLLAALGVASVAAGTSALVVLYRSVDRVQDVRSGLQTFVKAGADTIWSSEISEATQAEVTRELGARVSVERLGQHFTRAADGIVHALARRAVDASAPAMHGVTIDGRFPEPGSDGVVVGAALLHRLPQLARGTIMMNRHRWPITGVLHAAGTVLESEIWCDRSACDREFDPGPATHLTVANATVEETDRLRAKHGLEPLARTRARQELAPYRTAAAAAGSILAVVGVLALWTLFALARHDGGGRARFVAPAGLIVGIVAALVLLHGRQVELGRPWIAAPVRVSPLRGR